MHASAITTANFADGLQVRVADWLTRSSVSVCLSQNANFLQIF